MSTNIGSKRLAANQELVYEVLILSCQGLSQRAIAKKVGISRSSVQRIITNSQTLKDIAQQQHRNSLIYDDPKKDFGTVSGDITANSNVESYVIPFISTIKPPYLSAENALDFVESLAPINYNTPIYKGAATQNTNNIALVIGDNHFGAHSEVVNEIFFKFVEELRPSTIILNGDTLDMFAISKYPKDARYSCSLVEERKAYHDFLYTLHKITESYQTKIYETNANHSGDGIEGRWWRYLSERLGEVGKIPEVLEALSYKNVFLPSQEWSRVELVDYVEIVPGFLVMHGDVVRKHGGFSARGLFEKWFTSIIANHTHRIGMTAQRIPAIGSQKERIITVYENGCACDLRPLYATAANWQNGFSIVNYSGSNIGVEPVIINGNKACSTTLCKVISV